MKKTKWIAPLLVLAVVCALLAVLPFVASGAAADRTDSVTGITLTDADEDGYLEVGTADELKALGNLLTIRLNNISFELTADIDLNPGYTFSLDENDALVVTKDGEIVTDLSELYAWPYGTLYGSVQGNDFTISGLYQHLASDDGGLFGYGSSGTRGTIENLHIVNAYVRNESGNVGLLLGQSYTEGLVKNCTVEGIVVGIKDVGGIAGYHSGSIQNCTANVTVIGDVRVGGIVGNNDGTVEGCTVEGIVKGGTEKTGGLAGSAGSAIIDCINRATVTATGKMVGGMAGFAYNVGTATDTYISDCVNYGAISGGSCVGGIVGDVDTDTKMDMVIRSRNEANVIGTGDYVGGVVGRAYYAYILDCANAGNVNGGGDYTGGVAGDVTAAKVTRSYNTGAVSGGDGYTGGVIGFMYSTHVTYLYNTGTVSGVKNVGGIAGATLGNGSLRSVLSLGTVTGSGSYIGALIGENVNDAIACYYLDTVYSTGCGDEIDTIGIYEAVSAERLASGEIAYLLQRAALAEDGAVWGQRIDGAEKDAAPRFGAAIVYRGFDGCTPYYANTEPAVTTPSHVYEHGFCVKTLTSGETCGAYEPPVLKDGVYQIANAGNLYWFSAVVGGGYDGIPADGTICAVLTADITINPSVIVDGALNTTADLRPWIPIGTDAFAYAGHFDGNGHTVSGLYYTSEDQNSVAGLFGMVRLGGLIENVTVADSYLKADYYVGGLSGVLHTATARNCHVLSDVVLVGKRYVGGVIGLTNGYTTRSLVSECSFAGVATANAPPSNVANYIGGIVGNAAYCDMEYCINTGVLYDRGAVWLGGIAGQAYYTATIKNCLNAGTLHTLDANTGGIVGFIAKGSIENCLSVGTIVLDDGKNGYARALVSGHDTEGTFSYSHLYYDASVLPEEIYAIGTDVATSAFGYTTEALGTGEVAYLLGAAWGQTLGKDTYPSLGGDTVYAIWDLFCDGTPSDKCSTYSNDPNASPVTGLHDTNAHGYCTRCEVSIGYASITAGRDLTVHYYITVWDEALLARADELAMRFTMNGKTVTVPIDLSKKDGEEYVFSFGGIAPQCMSDNIAAELLLGNTVIDSLSAYSIKQNMEALIALYGEQTDAVSTALVELATDLLTYGAAAQIYRGHHTDSLANADLTTTPSEALPTAEDSVKALENVVETPAVTFTGATVWFDQVNKIIVKLSDSEGVTLIVKRNGETVEHTMDGTTVYTDGIYATDFDAVYTFELYLDGTHIQTFTYSVASYVYAMMNKTVSADSEELSAMASLARALYRYGVSASAYQTAVHADA